MARLILPLIVAAASILHCIAPAHALPNPAPGVFGDDDFTQLFDHEAGLISVELFDPFDATFGFLFSTGPEPIVPIFLPTDAAGTVALINFIEGSVSYLGGGTPRSFLPQTGPIAFYFFFESSSEDGLFLSTVNALNPGGADLVGTYPLLGSPDTYAILPYLPIGGSVVPVSATLVTPVAPAAIPEPTSVMLVAAGLALLLAGWRKRGPRPAIAIAR